jgi:hypothetical protein
VYKRYARVSFSFFFLSHDSHRTSGLGGKILLVALEHPSPLKIDAKWRDQATYTSMFPNFDTRRNPPPHLFTSISTQGGPPPPCPPILMRRLLHPRLPNFEARRRGLPCFHLDFDPRRMDKITLCLRSPLFRRGEETCSLFA